MFKVSKCCCVCTKQLVEIFKDQISDGVEFYDSAGYGSEHDLTHFKIAICDDCLTKMMNENVVQFEYRDFCE